MRSTGHRRPLKLGLRPIQLRTIPGENIPVTVTPAEVDNLVPMEDEIEDAVKKLRRNRSGGPSGM